MKGSSLPCRTLRNRISLPNVWPMPTPTAIGTAPAMADTCEPTTYASALMIGTIADTTPKPTEVSSASSSDQPKSGTSRPYREPEDQRPGLLDQRGQVVQAGDLGVPERRAAEPADGDHPVLGQRRHHHRGLAPAGRPVRRQVDAVRVVERHQVLHRFLVEVRCEGR